jgi:hypothetical protein
MFLVINFKNMNDSSVVVIIRLRAGRSRNRGSFPGRGKRFFPRLKLLDRGLLNRK